MEFSKDDIVSEEWEVVESVAKLIKKSPHWLINFKSNVIENHHFIKWDLCDVGLTQLPENFGNLSELKNLHLGRNKIRTKARENRRFISSSKRETT